MPKTKTTSVKTIQTTNQNVFEKCFEKLQGKISLDDFFQYCIDNHIVIRSYHKFDAADEDVFTSYDVILGYSQIKGGSLLYLASAENVNSFEELKRVLIHIETAENYLYKEGFDICLSDQFAEQE